MVGGSLLIVYEGDETRAKEALELWDQEPEDDESSDDDDEAAKKKPGPPFAVKLIDFAHTRLTPGQGPDEGVLKGFDTVLSLLQGRIDTLIEA